MWEAPLHYSSENEPVEIMLSLEGSNVIILSVDISCVTDNTTDGSNDRRWVSLKNGGSNLLSKSFRWPDKKIRFHYENQQAKDELSLYLDAAKTLWAAAGLPEEFRYEEVESEQEFEENKGQILLISINSNAWLEISLGVPSQDRTGPTPRMRLSTSDKIGTLNVVANFAHELGHAWGLHHEHQDPQCWTFPYTEADGDRVQFGDGHGQINCENLSDYERTRERLVSRYGSVEGMGFLRLACRSRASAVLYEFAGAIEWLPLDDQEDFMASPKPFDNKSIMLYTSQAGGEEGVDNGVDNRASVLEFRGDEKLQFNTMPSEQDVEGLKNLYGVERRAFLPLLSERSDASNSRFEAVRAADKGASCDN